MVLYLPYLWVCEGWCGEGRTDPAVRMNPTFDQGTAQDANASGNALYRPIYSSDGAAGACLAGTSLAHTSQTFQETFSESLGSDFCKAESSKPASALPC